MSRSRFVAMCIPLFMFTGSGAAFASGQISHGAPPQQAPQQAANVGETLSVLHAVGQWAGNISQMAEKKAKSDLVRNYARDMAAANANNDAKLTHIAQQKGINVGALDPQTEEGKSVLDRMKAETALLDSLEGDAFDKEYMTLVTNTQQSVLHFLDANKSTVTNPEVKGLLGEMRTDIQTRVNSAQDIMTKIYGNKI